MPNSAARRAGGAERWAPLVEPHRRARRRTDRSRHPCPGPGLPAPGSQKPRHGCLLLDADRWGKPLPFCLALKTQVPKAALLPAGGGEAVWGAGTQGTVSPLPLALAPAPGVPCPELPFSWNPWGTSSVCFSPGTLIHKPIVEPGGGGGGVGGGGRC